MIKTFFAYSQNCETPAFIKPFAKWRIVPVSAEQLGSEQLSQDCYAMARTRFEPATLLLCGEGLSAVI